MPTCPRKKISHQETLCHEGGDLLCIELLPNTTFKRQAPFSLEDALYYLTHRNMHISKEDITSEIIIMH